MDNVIKFKGVPRLPEEAPPKGFRRIIPDSVKVKVLLKQAPVYDDNFNKVTDPAALEWDHCPPIQQRRFDREKWDTIPPCNDPNFITVRVKANHREKTNKIDIPQIAKTKRLTREHLAFRNRILAKGEPEIARELEKELQKTTKTPLGRKILSRGFPKSEKQQAREKARKERENHTIDKEE